jgi:hypothetical protein
MAEIKNSFLKSKMNKDLDDRLIPNGEYRDAQNISVGKSEDDDIGALENVLGNDLQVTQLLTFSNQVISNNGAGNGLSINGNVAVEVGMTITGIDSNTELPFTTIVTLVTYNVGQNKTELQTAYSTQHTIAGDKVNVFFPLEVIGQYSDSPNNRIIFFLTSKDVNQQWPTNINNYYNPDTQFKNYIVSFNTTTKIQTPIATGSFLNFSVNHLMTGVTMIENLLYFTDNFNQPRQVNASNTDLTYYTEENHVSVAKFSPYEPVSLVRTTTSILTIDATGAGNAADPYILTIPANTAITVGMSVVSSSVSGAVKILGDSFIYVEAVNATGTLITLSVATAETTAITPPLATDVFKFLTSTMINQSTVSAWPGDPDFLQDKFVRFSYRFKYANNEYSLMAPFSQIAFVPSQKGYFFLGDEDSAYQSTILSWMENFIQQVQLLIPLPDVATNVASSYKISEIDVLYKESDALAVKVVQSINLSDIANNSITSSNTAPIFYGDGTFLPSNVLVYTYQSQKPYKTLPQAQTTRVFDKVPIKALAQESSGNRIIYGNYLNQHTPPASIDYRVGLVDKNPNIFNNWIEYPNHSIKQNRNYQVGFILADKFGRQSDVILSPVNANILISGGIDYGASTVYVPYKNKGQNFDVKGWFGDALQVIVNTAIDSSVSLDGIGAPGLYATETNVLGFAISVGAISGNEYTFTLDSVNFVNNIYVPIVGEYLRGAYTDFVEVTAVSNDGATPPVYTVTTIGQVNDVYTKLTTGTLPDTKWAYTLNNLGWYSYKVVVRQQEQDYYNVYLPGILNGYPKQIPIAPIVLASALQTNANAGAIVLTLSSVPSGLSVGMVISKTTGGAEMGTIITISGNTLTVTPILAQILASDSLTFTNPSAPKPFPTGENNKTAHIVLFNDNINKVPRDLEEVGPEQKQFRSSVQLFGRVENNLANSVSINNRQYLGLSPGYEANSNTVVTIGEAIDLNIIYDELSNPGGQDNFYQIDTNPLIARLNTPSAIGVTSTDLVSTNMRPFLAVYETDPQESLLNLFWESATEGLIADLNADVRTGTTGAASLTALGYVQNENQLAEGLTSATIATNNTPQGSVSIDLIANPSSNIVAGMEVFTVVGGTYTLIGTVLSLVGTTLTLTAGALQAVVGNINLAFYSTSAGNIYSRYVSDYFSPLSTEGAVITNSTITISSITNGALDTITTKFGIYANPNGNGSFRLFIKENTFTYVYNSNVVDVYTFNLNISVGTPIVITPVSATGSLTNIIPAVTNTAVTKTTTDTVMVDYLGNNLAQNGSSEIALKETGLSFSFTASTATYSFAINSVTGIISQTPGAHAAGTYILSVVTTDATNPNNGNTAAGLSVTIQQSITIGAQGLNSSSMSGTPCVADVVIPWSSSNTIQDRACVANGLRGDGDIYTGVWYLANSVLIASQLPATPNMQSDDGTVIQSAGYRLGAAQTSGNIAFLLNSRLYLDGAFPAPTSLASLIWDTYRREVGTSSWGSANSFADINNNTASGGVSVDYIRSNYDNATTGDTMYNQVVRAFSSVTASSVQKQYEYCIVARSMANNATIVSTTEKLVAWVQSIDLSFPSCVVDTGSKIVDNNYLSTTYYEYKYAGPVATPAGCTAPTQVSLYSSVPFGEYIDQFFTNQIRTTAWTPTDYTITNSYYRWAVYQSNTAAASALQPKPFTSLVYSGRFNTTLGSVYRDTTAGVTNVISCWSGTASTTTPQRQSKN